MNSAPLYPACATRYTSAARIASRVPTPSSIVSTPSADSVEYARMRFRSVSCTARYAPSSMVAAPPMVTAIVQTGVEPTTGVIRAMR
jgi:hypothetical protein